MSLLRERLVNNTSDSLSTEDLFAIIDNSSLTNIHNIQKKLKQQRLQDSSVAKIITTTTTNQDNNKAVKNDTSTQPNAESDQIINNSVSVPLAHSVVSPSVEKHNNAESASNGENAKNITIETEQFTEDKATSSAQYLERDTKHLNHIMRRAVRRYSIVHSVDNSNNNTNSNNASNPIEPVEIDPESVDWQNLLSKPCDTRTIEDIDLIYTYIKHLRIQFLKSLAPELLHQLCKHFMLVIHPKGHNIFCQGDIGKEFYIILSGSVSIHLREEEEELWAEVEKEMDQNFKKKGIIGNSTKIPPVLSRTNSSENHSNRSNTDSSHNTRPNSGTNSVLTSPRGGTHNNKGFGTSNTQPSMTSEQTMNSLQSDQSVDGLQHIIHDPSHISIHSHITHVQRANNYTHANNLSPTNNHHYSAPTRSSTLHTHIVSPLDMKRYIVHDLYDPHTVHHTHFDSNTSEHDNNNHNNNNRTIDNVKEHKEQHIAKEEKTAEELTIERKHREWLLEAKKQRTRAEFEAKTVEIMTLTGGQAFGEIALLSANNIRTATVTCKERTYLLSLDKDSYLSALKDKDAQERNRKFNFIQSHSLFKRLSHEKQISLAIALKERNLQRNTILVKENEPVIREYDTHNNNNNNSNNNNNNNNSHMNNNHILNNAGLSCMYFVGSGELIIKKSLFPETTNLTGIRDKSSYNNNNHNNNAHLDALSEEELNLLLKMGKLDPEFNQTIELSKIENGGYCGEEAFIDENCKVRNYTIITGQSQTLVYTLNYTNFHRFIRGSNLAMMADLAKTRETLRIERIKTIIKDYLYAKTNQYTNQTYNFNDYIGNHNNNSNNNEDNTNHEVPSGTNAYLVKYAQLPTIFHKHASPRKALSVKRSKQSKDLNNTESHTANGFTPRKPTVNNSANRNTNNNSSTRNKFSNNEIKENNNNNNNNTYIDEDIVLSAEAIDQLLGVKRSQVHLASLSSSKLPLSALSALSPLPPDASLTMAELNSNNNNTNNNDDNNDNDSANKDTVQGDNPKYGRRNSQLSFLLGLGTGAGFSQVSDPNTGEVMHTDRKKLMESNQIEKTENHRKNNNNSNSNNNSGPTSPSNNISQLEFKTNPSTTAANTNSPNKSQVSVPSLSRLGQYHQITIKSNTLHNNYNNNNFITNGQTQREAETAWKTMASGDNTKKHAKTISFGLNFMVNNVDNENNIKPLSNLDNVQYNPTLTGSLSARLNSNRSIFQSTAMNNGFSTSRIRQSKNSNLESAKLARQLAGNLNKFS